MNSSSHVLDPWDNPTSYTVIEDDKLSLNLIYYNIIYITSIYTKSTREDKCDELMYIYIYMYIYYSLYAFEN